MRRQLVIWVTAAALLAGAFGTIRIANAQITLNGQQIAYRTAPFTIGDFYMVPLQETVAALGGGPVAWDSRAREARFIFQGADVIIRDQSGYAIVDGQPRPLGVPALIRLGQLYVPVSFFRTQFGVNVSLPTSATAPVREQVLGFRGGPAVPRPGDIAIGGISLFNLTTPGDAPSVAARAAIVTERLNNALQLGNGILRPEQITVGDLNGTPTLFAAGLPLVSVTAADAAVNQITPPAQANIWAAQIRAGLAQVFSGM